MAPEYDWQSIEASRGFSPDAFEGSGVSILSAVRVGVMRCGQFFVDGLQFAQADIK